MIGGLFFFSFLLLFPLFFFSNFYMFEVMGFDENLRKWMEVHVHAISWSLGVLKRVKFKGFSFVFFFW